MIYQFIQVLGPRSALTNLTYGVSHCKIYYVLYCILIMPFIYIYYLPLRFPPFEYRFNIIAGMGGPFESVLRDFYS